ncbi:hypothetical protein OIO90_004370 [Microbotryomycetes sp. JL221]|nr:hypothetical protein OIO90_004370 [Microbotryomycetes sp. JL221]
MRVSRLARQALHQRTSNNSDGASLSKSVEYCTSLIRQTDKDQLWPMYFYPPQTKHAYIALRAFNIELATIDDNVSNPVVGQMRFQWWRDAIKHVYEPRDHAGSAHPVCHLLSSLPQLDHLSLYHFTRLINTREQHFLNPSFHDLQDLANYSAGTQSSLLYLLLQATHDQHDMTTKKLPHSQLFQHVGNEHDDHDQDLATTTTTTTKREPDDLTLDHAASHLAVAMTISILLKSIPYHATKRINVIPTVIAARHDLKEENLFRQGPNAHGLRESVATLVGIAQAELKTARQCFNNTTGLTKRASPVFLSATPARSYLERLSSTSIEFDVFNSNLFKQYWKLPFQIWSDARHRRF